MKAGGCLIRSRTTANYNISHEHVDVPSLSANSYTMSRLIEDKLDISAAPESTFKRGLLRRPNKVCLVSLGDFEQGVEDKYQLLKGSQECFIEPEEDKSDASSNEVAQMNTELYAQSLHKDTNTTKLERKQKGASKLFVSTFDEIKEANDELVETVTRKRSAYNQPILDPMSPELLSPELLSPEEDASKDIGGDHRDRDEGGINENRDKTDAVDDIGEGGAEDDIGEGGAEDDIREDGAEDDSGEGGATDDSGEDGATDDSGEDGATDDSGEDGATDDSGEDGAEDDIGEGDIVDVVGESEAGVIHTEEKVGDYFKDVESNVRQNKSSLSLSRKSTGVNEYSHNMQRTRVSEKIGTPTAESIHLHRVSVSRPEESPESSESSDDEDLDLAQNAIHHGIVKRKENNLMLTELPETPDYIKSARFASTDKPAVSKRIQRAKSTKPKKQGSVFPSSQVKKIFNHHAQVRVSKEALVDVEKCLDMHVNQLAADLSTYAAHANRKTITRADMELLMKRQRLVTDTTSLNVLIEKHLPLECRKLLIPCAMSGNKVFPKL